MSEEQEERALLGAQREEVSPQRRRILALAIASAFGVVALRGNVLAPATASLMAAVAPSAAAAPATGVRLSNQYTRKFGREIGNGLYKAHGHLAEAHKATRLEFDHGEGVMWSIEGVYESSVPEPSIEVKFTPGKHSVTATAADGSVTTFDVTSKYVRREIRDLTDDDRNSYLNALHTIYFTEQSDGEEKYGSDFKSSSWLVREHLQGAAQQDCDHWHDDAGILTHHVGVTWQMEMSIQSVDSSVCAHYWDYTIDSAADYDWWDSPIFADDWFGTVSNTNNETHVLDTGRWAYTPVLQAARDFSNITNPWGLLRSPWNTNPSPYILRDKYTLDHLGDGYSTFPSCTEFGNWLESADTLGDLLFALNGALHGPVHIMIGGHWGFLDNRWEAVTKELGFTDSMLLLSKVLWRQGYVRCPDTCSVDVPIKDCTCSCPASILREREAREILNITGIDYLNPNSDMKTLMEENDLSDDDFLRELCHVGFPGEMFTSAAPQDPTFWPLHGNAERYLQYARLLNAEGTLTFSEAWGYSHAKSLPSDTGFVCDWAGIDPYTDMSLPTCVMETCPGHKADDTLPFEDLMSDQVGLYTNQEFYDMLSPFNTNLPYVYDSLSYWPGCTNGELV